MPTKKTKKTTTKKEETIEVKVSKPKKTGKYFYANGKRKCSIARVRLYKGKGVITINDQPVEKFFKIKTLVGTVKSPLKLTGSIDKFDVVAFVKGGGQNSQSQAIRHGIAKALAVIDPLMNKITLKKAALLTRDARTKERKKFGLKRARKAPQFSKR
ncbi:30S ribosomal protein S9 [Patescibacteria group bacterium]